MRCMFYFIFNAFKMTGNGQQRHLSKLSRIICYNESFLTLLSFIFDISFYNNISKKPHMKIHIFDAILMMIFFSPIVTNISDIPFVFSIYL